MSMRDEENDNFTAIEDDEEPGNSLSAPLHTSFSPKPSTVIAAHITPCTCGTCETCQLRAFLLAHGKRLGWKRLRDTRLLSGCCRRAVRAIVRGDTCCERAAPGESSDPGGRA